MEETQNGNWMVVILQLHLYESKKKWITMKLLHAKSASKSLFPLHKYPEDIESILRKQIESTAKIYSF